MADVEVNFEDYSVQVLSKMDSAVGKFLLEASAEVIAQTVRNSRTKSGKTKGAWKAEIDEETHTATIGNPLENAVWEEFGTGEYAVEGNGRKGWWVYVRGSETKKRNEDRKVYTKWEAIQIANHLRKKGLDAVITNGKRPNHTLQRAFDSKKEMLKKRGTEIMALEINGMDDES